MDIGVVIKCRRQKRNMTQAELAALLNITPQAVSRWEMGISYPDIVMLPKISEALQVSADELLGIRQINVSRRAGEAGEDMDPILNQSQADSIFDYIPGSPTEISKKILIVDDSDYMRMTLEDILTRCGHTVLPARNGQECLDLLRSKEIDVCVLDIVMPVMDGIETLRRIKAEKPEVRVVMLSALCRESSVRLAQQLGADAFVVKPFQEGRLIERIR